ncbi:hypothetical protein B7486_55720 [cyanobacterium TDX16]|nr:hypothetical protein B7486_55720 [cyanobacterium TDX16]
MARPSASGRAWLRSGMAELTGRADGPALLPPDVVVERIKALGRQAGVDALTLASERGRLQGLHRQGTTSCDGTTRLLPSADAWLAVTLADPHDIAAVPAWLELDPQTIDPADPWAVVGAAVADRPAAALVARATLLSLAVSSLGEHERAGPGPAVATQLGGLSPMRRRAPIVLDLSSSWAGPLCGAILADAGAEVFKVESTSRPDPARERSPALYELLNGMKERTALDLELDAEGAAEDRSRLQDLVAQADVVVESSGVQALAALGFDAEACLLAPDGPRIWVSITGHGGGAERGGTGDDAAVAGGLVAWDETGPCFAGDEIAAPLAGITAAGIVRTALQAGGRWLADVSLAGVAAHVAEGLEQEAWRPAP